MSAVVGEFDSWVQGWDAYYQSLEFTEARLDCVEGQSLLEGWASRLLPAPDDLMDSLASLMIDDWREALEICSSPDASFADLRSAKGLFIDTQAALDRITDRLSDLEG